MPIGTPSGATPIGTETPGWPVKFSSVGVHRDAQVVGDLPGRGRQRSFRRPRRHVARRRHEHRVSGEERFERGRGIERARWDSDVVVDGHLAPKRSISARPGSNSSQRSSHQRIDCASSAELIWNQRNGRSSWLEDVRDDGDGRPRSRSIARQRRVEGGCDRGIDVGTEACGTRRRAPESCCR